MFISSQEKIILKIIFQNSLAIQWLRLGTFTIDRSKIPQAIQFSSVQFSPSVVSDCLRHHESQHARPPCPSPTPRVHSNSGPSSRWCHPVISSSVVPFSSCPQSFPASVFSNESTLHMRWPKYWSFSFSIGLSNEHPGLEPPKFGKLQLLYHTIL